MKLRVIRPAGVYVYARPDMNGLEEVVYVALTSWKKGRRSTARVMVLASNRSWHKPGSTLTMRRNDPMWRMSKALDEL